jgi:hypothetical protein
MPDARFWKNNQAVVTVIAVYGKKETLVVMLLAMANMQSNN